MNFSCLAILANYPTAKRLRPVYAFWAKDEDFDSDFDTE